MLTKKEYNTILGMFCKDIISRYEKKLIKSMSNSILEKYLNYPDSDRINFDIQITYSIKEIKKICKNKKCNFISKFFRKTK